MRSISFLILSLVCFTTSATTPAEHLRLDFSKPAIDAINAGVLLQIDGEYGHLVSLGFIKFAQIKNTHHFYLGRHALSNRYLVKVDNSEFPHLFRSLNDATRFVSARAQTLLDNYHDADQTIFMRLRLNKYQLPAPMRLKAFISRQWNIQTRWQQ